MVQKNPIQRYNFETGIYRPPSEGGSRSLLVRFTRNCPWNLCGFCGMYKEKKFSVRPLKEIKADIDAMAAFAQDLLAAAKRAGHPGTITREAIISLLGDGSFSLSHQGLGMLLEWLSSGASTAFLQDANSLIMKTRDLTEALSYLRLRFPSIRRVTSYARAKTVFKKTDQELKEIRGAGLDRLHLGLETGDDALLKLVKKGVTSEQQIRAGRKAIRAGFEVSEYWMPGLGGKELTRQHALNTARVLNAINPHYIRSRPFHPWPGTPMYEEMIAGRFVPLTPREQLMELRLTIGELNVTSRVCFDHAGNYWKDEKGRFLFSHGYEGYPFPEQKETVLSIIDRGLKCM